MIGRFRHRRGPFWFFAARLAQLWAVLVWAVLAMGRFGIDPNYDYALYKFTVYFLNLFTFKAHVIDYVAV